MSTATKQSAVAAFLAHCRDELAAIMADVEKGLATITPIADAAAPIAATVLTIAGQPAAAAGVTAGDKLLDTANGVAQHGVSASTIPGLVNDIEEEVKKL